jgi:uncharacterized protein YggE
MIHRIAVIVLASAMGTAAIAAEPANIIVSGVGQILTPPDIARATFNVRGEGQTADAATSALATKLDAVREGMAALEGTKLAWSTGEMHVGPVRGDDCNDRYDGASKLSIGKCAIAGYVATLEVKAEIAPPDQVGTMLGLAARLGAENGNAAEFTLKDASAAEREAAALAFADAQKKAQAIAEGSGVRLGRLVNVTDSAAIAMELTPPPGAKTITVTAARLQPRPPVAVALRPELVPTKAQLSVTYAIAP